MIASGLVPNTVIIFFIKKLLLKYKKYAVLFNMLMSPSINGHDVNNLHTF
ncbi:hypothetical protein SPI02_15370 [Staphylococcus piscifermentans]|uniref:Uncharacterized protein n=1 Tax=Staphylococcus piscifermentans TaxID=70258 RepID=A0A512QNC9_9STAP|nr:hypothetical protein SPI02_15370 [Staphylococcus piscifermentans]